MKRKNYGPIPSYARTPQAVQALSDACAFDHAFGIDYYDPRNLPALYFNKAYVTSDGCKLAYNPRKPWWLV
jgi:hypothetical protein